MSRNDASPRARQIAGYVILGISAAILGWVAIMAQRAQ